jgi:hypothetical protein
MRTGTPRSTSCGRPSGRVRLRLLSLAVGGVETDPESFDFAKPAVATCFADTFAEVVDDLDELAALAWVDLEDGAADAGMLVP